MLNATHLISLVAIPLDGKEPRARRLGTRPTEFELKESTRDTLGENPLTFKNDGDLVKWGKKKFGRLPLDYEEILRLKKGALTKRPESPQAISFGHELFLIEMLKPLLHVFNDNIEDMLAIPDTEEELRDVVPNTAVHIKYAMTILFEELAKTEFNRQLAEAKHLAANPKLTIEAESVGSKRKVFDPMEEAKTDTKRKKLRSDALKSAFPRLPAGKTKRTYPPAPKPELGPDGTPWRGGARRGRGGRGRGGGRGQPPANPDKP